MEFPEVLDANEFIDSKQKTNEYTYDLFAVLVHSGSANGGHYYAYIRAGDDWYCFNDNQVTKVTTDDVKRTFGGGSTEARSPFSSSTNAYMLIYRQKSESNAKAMTEEEFGEHLKSVRESLNEEDSLFKERAMIDAKMIKMKVFYDHPEKRRWMDRHLVLDKDAKLSDALQTCKTLLGVETPNEQCRLVRYDDASESIEGSLEDSMDKTMFELFGGTQPYYRNDLMLETRELDEPPFDNYAPGGHTLGLRQVVLGYDEIKRPFRVYLNSQHTVKDIASK